MSDDTLEEKIAEGFTEHVNSVLCLRAVESVCEMSPDDLWACYQEMCYDMAFLYGRPPDEVMQAIAAGRMYESLLQQYPGNWKLFSSSLAKRKYTFSRDHLRVEGLLLHQPPQEEDA